MADGKIRTAVCGIGNTRYGDEGIGSVIARELASEMIDKNVKVIDCGANPRAQTENILRFGPRRIIIVSAIDLGKPPGSVETIEPEKLNKLLASTHNVGIDLFIDFLKNALEAEVSFIAIQPKTAALGSGMSSECRIAVFMAKEAVKSELKSPRR